MPGEILKKRREDLKHNLKDIAHILKIRYDYLKAIEDNTFNKLPSGIYARGYIREYAKFLKLDTEPLVKLYLEKITPAPTVPIPPSRRTSNMKYILIPVTLCLGLIVFLSVTSTEKTKTKLAKNTSQTVNKNQYNHEAKNTTNTNEQKASTEKKQATVKKMETKKEYDLQILASDTTWLSVNIDNTNPKEMLLKQGENIRFHATQNFFLKIGNAGGVTIVLDGKDLGSPGGKGEVISLNLPHDNLSAFNAY